MTQDNPSLKNRLGDAPIEAEYRQNMNDVAQALDRIFNGDARGSDRKIGFILMVFQFGDLGGPERRCNYISNGADREAVVALLKEQIAYLEGRFHGD